jgi:hypothetical protein
MVTLPITSDAILCLVDLASWAEAEELAPVIPVVIPQRITPHDQPVSAGRRIRLEQRGRHSVRRCDGRGSTANAPFGRGESSLSTLDGSARRRNVGRPLFRPECSDDYHRQAQERTKRGHPMSARLATATERRHRITQEGRHPRSAQPGRIPHAGAVLARRARPSRRWPVAASGWSANRANLNRRTTQTYVGAVLCLIGP